MSAQETNTPPTQVADPPTQVKPEQEPETQVKVEAGPVVATASKAGASNRISREENKIITEILLRLSSLKDEEYAVVIQWQDMKLTFDSDNELMDSFQRLVSRKSLPDYFEVIKEPIAFSTIRVCF